MKDFIMCGTYRGLPVMINNRMLIDDIQPMKQGHKIASKHENPDYYMMSDPTLKKTMLENHNKG